MQNIEVYRRDADPATPHTIYEDVVRIRPLKEFVDEYLLGDGRKIVLDAREYHIILYTVRQTPQARYDAKNMLTVSMRLNRKTDADIITLLEKQENKQGYIKSILRKELSAE